MSARALFALLAICVLSFPASAQSLKAHKDRLFAYPKVLEQGYDGDYLKLDYRSSRDIDDRDEVRGARVQSYYINMRPRRSQEEMSFSANGRTIEYARVGKPKGAKWIVIFLHGRNGDRSLGMNDWSFGGNFNRIKNLAVRNQGLYITPTITNFEAQGAADVAALAARYTSQVPKAKLILACGSMGAQICWQYLNGSSKISGLDGAIMLGAFADNGFLATPAATGRGPAIPLILAHGTDDNAFAFERTQNLFQSLKVSQPNYPARLLLFNTGSHGTPIRMIDWRRELTWILGQ